MHPHKTTHFELSFITDVNEIGTFFNSTLVYADISELTVLTVFELESKSNRRLGGIRGENHLFLVVVQVQRLVFNVRRRRQVAYDGIKKRLNSLVLIGTAYINGNQLICQGTDTDGLMKQLFRNLLTFHHQFHHLIVEH